MTQGGCPLSFDATDIIPIEYQSLFRIISPIEKSGILKILREKYSSLKDKYEALFQALKDYLINYQSEDISSLSFIMFGQISLDLLKNEKITQMLELYPNSSELKCYNIQLQVDKGIFEGVNEVIEASRLKPTERNMIFNRLVAADKLARIILDLQSFLLEIMFYSMKQDYEKAMSIFTEAEDIWHRILNWIKDKEITFVTELVIRAILQKCQILLSAKGLDVAIKYYETDEIQSVLKQAKSFVTKTNILHVAAMLYYSTGQPKKGLKHLEKAIKILKKVHGRNSWKSIFYHNLAYMYTLLDKNKSIEAYEKCIELLEGTDDLQSLASVLSNLIGLHTQANRKGEARKRLKQLVEILDQSDELVTSFRAYAVASNAMSLDDYQLAKKYLKILEEKVEQAPTLMNKAIKASAYFAYYLDVEINSEKAYKYGEEALFYITKQKDYLNALAIVFNLVTTDLQFYKITEKDRYLNNAKRRLKELLTLVGALNQPKWKADKNIVQASFEILSQNYDQAKSFISIIPKTTDKKVNAKKKMLKQLLEFSKRKESKPDEETTPEPFPDQPLLNELATNKDATKIMVMHILEQTLEELVQLPQQVDPIKADIKLILLINDAGLTIYTKVFDIQKMNQQLISNFISAIDSFGKQLFGTTEPYFSITRGNNIILYRNINDNLNLALIVSQENFDAIMKLNTLALDIASYLKETPTDLNHELTSTDHFHTWLETKVDEMLK